MLGCKLIIIQRLPELEVLLALCKAAPLVQSADTAEQLLNQLSPYLLGSHTQVISHSSGLRDISPSPWEVLTNSLTSAILSIGLSHEILRPKVAATLDKYIEGWASVASSLSANQFDDDNCLEYAIDGELSRVMTLSVSLLGFLDSAAKHARFWTAYERLQLIELIRRALVEKFMIAFEAALSVVRNARSSQQGLREWKSYTKHYAALGRPLGAMLLHEGFMQLVVACASLLVGPADHKLEEPVLDFLQAPYPRHDTPIDSLEDALLQGLTQIAIEEMERLQNDLDYLQQVGSAWQQRLASTVKANALTTFLCCTVCNEEVADSDVLMSWLEATLTDPVQIADENLASVVLKSMSILAKLSPSISSVLSRSLPRIIVQGGLDSRTATVAADCLASVLKLLPQDAIITTLYSLGNVLSAGSLPDRGTATSPLLNGSTKAHRHLGIYNHQTTGSAISLTPSDEEEPSHVYATVIHTIVGIARSCKDEKITALALSILIQKYGRVNQTVDAKIITESALLGVYSGPSELRSLLKLYSRLSHDSLVKNDVAMLEAVRVPF